jgi:hypothetical protein
MTTKIDVSPRLYEAATESLVADSSANSTFEKMISVAYTHGTLDTFVQELKATEKQIKAEFEVGAMPGPWRSAKSVIQSAMRLKLSLCDDNAVFYGKTYLQNKIKEAKTETKVVTEEDYISRICKLLSNVPEDMDAKKVHSEVHKFLMESL